jgi:hypothetical protein
MQFEGTTSWRFAVSAGDERPHLALFVRDAVGLRVADSPDVPPKLAGVVPDHRDLLTRMSARSRSVSGQAGGLP